MRAIYLIGFMGSGKTSVAKALREKLSVESVDTDEKIELAAEKTIPEIFKIEGENRFRDYETKVLKRLSNRNIIVATGGGIIERTENVTWMKRNGIVIYLHTSWEEIADRLTNDETRPLWKQSEQDRKKLYQNRESNYISASDEIVGTDKKTPKKIAEEIIDLINNN